MEERDSDGTLYGYPERSCSICRCFPCMDIFISQVDEDGKLVNKNRALESHLVCDFAKYGCSHFLGRSSHVLEMYEVLRVLVREIYQSPDGYTHYVLENLDDTPKYIWPIRVPNWNTPHEPRKGDIGFAKHRYVIGGLDKWYDPDDGKFYEYRNTQDYLEGFILETKKIDKLML